MMPLRNPSQAENTTNNNRHMGSYESYGSFGSFGGEHFDCMAKHIWEILTMCWHHIDDYSGSMGSMIDGPPYGNGPDGTGPPGHNRNGNGNGNSKGNGNGNGNGNSNGSNGPPGHGSDEEDCEMEFAYWHGKIEELIHVIYLMCSPDNGSGSSGSF